MLIGVTADEGSWFARRAGLDSRRALAGYVREVYGEALAPSVLKRHAPQRGKPADWLAASSRLITAQFRETLHATARAQRRLTPQVYAYEFRRSRIPPGQRVALGDYHSAELPYVFDRLPPELAADAYHAALADELAARWVAFARHGTPNPPGLPAWVAYPASPDEHRAATALNRAGLAKPAATNPACTPPSCAAEP
jgi:para-nitrobenzyl esterase